MQCVVTEAQVFISTLDGKLFLNWVFSCFRVGCARVCVFLPHVCALPRWGRGKLVCRYVARGALSQLWPLKHLTGPGGRRGRVENQCDRGQRGVGQWWERLHRLSELIKEPGVCCVYGAMPWGGGGTVGGGGRAVGSWWRGWRVHANYCKCVCLRAEEYRVLLMVVWKSSFSLMIISTDYMSREKICP